MALPMTLGGKDKSALGRSSAPFEIRTTCALLEGTKTTMSRTETARAARIQPACLFICALPNLRGNIFSGHIRVKKSDSSRETCGRPDLRWDAGL